MAVIDGCLLLALTLAWSLDRAWRQREEVHRLSRHWEQNRAPSHQNLIQVLTFIGQWWVLALVALALAAILLSYRQQGRALAVVGAAATALGLVLVGKLTLPISNAITTYGLHLGGFPSGHAADATVLAGLVALVLARHRVVPVAVVAAAVVGAAVGWSRVETGAHTTAEAIAGWLLGMLIICSTLAVERWVHTGSTRPDLTHRSVVATERSVP